MPIFDYDCERCGTVDEHFFVGGALIPETLVCGRCSGPTVRIMGAPMIHTVETHLRGIRDPGISSDSGGYWDPNIVDRSGKPQYVRSLAHKRALLKENGLSESSRSEGAEDRLKTARRISVSG